MTTQERKPLNAFFVVMAALSALPTLFFGLVFLVGGLQSFLAFLATGWCGMWTYVWWSLRYR